MRLLRDRVLDTVLTSALNVRARAKRPWAFASANSEDAASWTIARARASIGSLASFLSPGVRSLSSDPGQALLWGVPLTAGAADAVAAPRYKGWDTYPPSPSLFASDDAGVRKAGWYELTRNWVIGNRALHDARFVLVNLGPAKLANQAASFGDELAQGPQRVFEHRRWAEVLDASPVLPTWAVSYAA